MYVTVDITVSGVITSVAIVRVTHVMMVVMALDIVNVDHIDGARHVRGHAWTALCMHHVTGM